MSHHDHPDMNEKKSYSRSGDKTSLEGRESFVPIPGADEVTDVVDEFAVNIPMSVPVPCVDSEEDSTSESEPSSCPCSDTRAFGPENLPMRIDRELRLGVG